MNISVTILRLGAGLAFAIWAAFSANAMAAEAVAPTVESTSMPAVSTEAHPIGAWIEKNAAWFGLFLKGPLKGKEAVEKKPAEQREVRAIDNEIEKNIEKNSGGEVDRQKIFAPPPAALRTSDAAAQISAVMKDLDYGSVCSKFASRKGFGPYGEFIIEKLVRGRAARVLEGTDDLRRACPAYDSLGVREKSYVWVKILAAMTFKESSCDPSKSAPGPNGTAAGLLALHEGNEDEAAPGCEKNDSKSPLRSLSCGLSILEKQIRRTGHLFSRDSHFGVLRPQGDLVATKDGKKRVFLNRLVVGALKELPLCRRD